MRLQLSLLTIALLPAISLGAFLYSDVVVKVDSLTWSRKMDIEKFSAKLTSAWCDEVPEKADVLDIKPEVKSKDVVERRKLPDGRLYTERQVYDWYAPDKRTAKDGKDYTLKEFIDHYGTDDGGKGYKEWRTAKASEVEEEMHKKNMQHAKDKWVEAPPEECAPEKEGVDKHDCFVEEVYDLKCEYNNYVWEKSRELEEKGSGVNLKWPESNVEPCEKVVVGCERERNQDEKFVANIIITQGAENIETTCGQDDMKMDLWQKLEEGKSYKAERYTIGGLHCDSIEVKDYVDVTEKFGGKEKLTITEDNEVKCCCLEGKSTNLCELGKTDPNAFGILGDPNGCGALMAQRHTIAKHTSYYHSYTKTPTKKCIVPTEDAAKLNVGKQEL